MTPQKDFIQSGATLGSKEHYSANLAAFSAGIGGALEWEKARNIDADFNDLERSLGGAQLQEHIAGWQIDSLVYGQKKEFGAQGYYGIPATQKASETTEDTLLFLGATRGEREDAFFRISSAWRQFDDAYQTLGVDRDVRSRWGSVMVEGRTLEIQNVALSLRGDLENERVSGTYSADRTRGSLLISPELRLTKVHLSAGLNSVFQTSESREFLPQVGANWLLTDNSTLYLSYSETVQQPDFQTLENNPLLNLQKSDSTELGFRQFVSERFDWHVAAFFRKLENASDWIAGNATDLGTLSTAGMEAKASFYLSDTLEVQAFYQWAHKDNSQQDGLYALDYPEHLLNFSSHWNFLPNWTLFTTQILRYQTENSLRTSNDFGADGSVGLYWIPAAYKTLRVSLVLNNMWNSDFQQIAGLDPRPTTVLSGVTVTW